MSVGSRSITVTVYRWVQRFTPLLADAAGSCRRMVGDRWLVDETYVKVAGRWRYVYRPAETFIEHPGRVFGTHTLVTTDAGMSSSVKRRMRVQRAHHLRPRASADRAVGLRGGDGSRRCPRGSRRGHRQRHTVATSTVDPSCTVRKPSRWNRQAAPMRDEHRAGTRTDHHHCQRTSAPERTALLVRHRSRDETLREVARIARRESCRPVVTRAQNATRSSRSPARRCQERGR